MSKWIHAVVSGASPKSLAVSSSTEEQSDDEDRRNHFATGITESAPHQNGGRLLAQRFGAVAPSWQKRIRRAELVTLERWFNRAIVAPDLPSVFTS